MANNLTNDPLFTKAWDAFKSQFGCEPTYAAQAPGRVNLIGEHTDYNDGFVLPMALPMRAILLGKPNDSEATNVLAVDQKGEVATFPLENLEPGDNPWANYVKGVIKQMQDNGYNVPNFDACIVSDVPIGGGLSSSAALEVATLTLCEQFAGKPIEPVQKALWAQKAEHDFADMPCGIMDQFISVMGEDGHALLIDCRSHETRQVKLDDPDVTILVTNSNVKHQLTGSEYPTRRKQCETAAAAFQKHFPEIQALRDVTSDQLTLIQDEVEPVIFNRARHVISENERTLQAADAFDARDYVLVGKLMYESHASLKTDFEVSTPELDYLVELTRQVNGVYGSRMTGGGFGGCTVTLVKTEAVEELQKHIAEEYLKQTNMRPTFFAVQPSVGALKIALD